MVRCEETCKQTLPILDYREYTRYIYTYLNRSGFYVKENI